MSTTENIPLQFSANSLAAIDADRVANNTNGSNPNGEQFADVGSYLKFLIGMNMTGACRSYQQAYGTAPLTDLVEGDIGYVAPPVEEEPDAGTEA